MRKVKEKVTTFWHNIHPGNCDRYIQEEREIQGINCFWITKQCIVVIGSREFSPGFPAFQVKPLDKQTMAAKSLG